MSTPSAARTRATPSPGASPHLPHSNLVLAVIVGCQLMIGLDTSIVTIALPDIQHGLHISASGLAWIQNAYMLTFGGLLLLGGRAGDILGRRRVFVAGVAVFTTASLLGGFATAGWWLLAARALQGLGAAIAGPSALALIATSFEGTARVRALSIFSAVTGAGGAIGMLAGGALTDWVSWQWVFFVNVPLGVLLTVLAPRFIRETERRPGRFDLAGALTSTVGMLALVYGFIRAGSDGWRDGRTLISFALAAVLLALFLAIETRVRQPIVPLHLFADRSRAGAFLNMLLLCAGMFGMFYFLTQFLQDVLGFGPLQAGAAFLPMVLMQFACVRTVPRLLPRFGAKPIAVTGAALVTAGLLWLAQISDGSGYAASALGPMLLMGMGGGLSIMPLNLIILSSVPPQESGAASGLAQTMIWAGGGLGSAVLVTVFGTASRHAAEHLPAGARSLAQEHHVLTQGMASAFTASAIFAVCALAVSLFVIRSKPA
jgi:EmrB/QacA subfamily drug resistance transporter